MRLEILVLAALATFASAAPQWPYRDAVAPYYYGYPGKTPYMYRANEEDDERDETYLARQDLKVATSDGGSTVTVVEDDEKADGVRVVETGSAKPVAQSSNTNQVQQDQQPAAQSSSSPAQAQQPLNNNANNAQQQTATSNGQPLTVQQPGQQPPAFPPARPNNNQNRPQRPVEEEDEEDDDEDSEEDDEDAEDEEEEGDDEDEDEDEEDEEERKRNDVAQKDNSGSEEPIVPQQIAIQRPIQPISPVANSEASDEVVPEEQPAPVSQQAVVINKVNKNKQIGAAAVAAAEKPKKKVVNSKTKSPSGGAIEALVPGYVTDQGEVLVPVDTVTGNQPITIVPDPFSPPSRIVAGPRPIPQSAVPSTPSRQVPYWYRSSPVINPLTQDIPTPLARQTLYSPVPPPGSIFTFDDDDDDDEDTPAVIPGQRLRQDAADDDDDDDDKDEDEEADQKAQKPKPQKVPLAAVPAVGNSGEDDEAEALAFVNTGKPVSNRRPQGTSASSSSGSTTSGNKKPAAGSSTGGANQGTSNESESEEDVEESDEQDEEDEEEEEDEEDDSAARRAVVSPVNGKGRMYVDEEYVSFPPSRSPTLFAVIQGKFPYPGQGNRQPQPQIISSPNPNNPFQRYVVRVTPSNRVPRPPVSSSPLYYRPLATPSGSSGSPNRRVVPIASFDVSVEDTRPSGISSGPSSIIVDSDEEGDFSGPTPVTSYPFVYKVQGSLQGVSRVPSGGPRPGPGPYGIRPPRPSPGYFGSPSGPPRPSYGPYGGPPPYSILSALYGGSPYGPRPSPSSNYGPPRPAGISGGPPVIIRKKPSGGSNRPPKPHLIAVYNPTGPSSGPREPVDEEYYTFEVPETENKLVPGQNRPPSKNKRPTVHRKPTPVIKQKLVSEDEESSDESAIVPPPPRVPIKIIPQGTVRRRNRGGKQLKPKKNAKKTSTTLSKKPQNQQDQHDPLGLLSKINKSKSKLH